MKSTLRAFTRAALCALAFSASAAHAVAITYSVADIPDATPGQDLWRYSYEVSGPFGAFGGFTLIYPYASFGDLNLTNATPPGDWFVTLINPDPSLTANGLFSAQALMAFGSTPPGTFDVEVVWKASGTPGVQTFEVFDDSFAVVAEGLTRPAGTVPEPGSLFLAALGAGVLLLRRHVSQKR